MWTVKAFPTAPSGNIRRQRSWHRHRPFGTWFLGPGWPPRRGSCGILWDCHHFVITLMLLGLNNEQMNRNTNWEMVAKQHWGSCWCPASHTTSVCRSACGAAWIDSIWFLSIQPLTDSKSASCKDLTFLNWSEDQGAAHTGRATATNIPRKPHANAQSHARWGNYCTGEKVTQRQPRKPLPWAGIITQQNFQPTRFNVNVYMEHICWHRNIWWLSTSRILLPFPLFFPLPPFPPLPQNMAKTNYDRVLVWARKIRSQFLSGMLNAWATLGDNVARTIGRPCLGTMFCVGGAEPSDVAMSTYMFRVSVSIKSG